MAFSELLGRSSFSFLQGASSPEEMVETAQAFGLKSLALCDRDGLYGSVRAHARAKELGFQFHVGAELSLANPDFAVPRLAQPRPPNKSHKKGSTAAADRAAAIREQPQRFGLSLLAQNSRGYESLCRLLSAAHAGLPKGESLLEWQHLRAHHEGLIALLPAQPWAFRRLTTETSSSERELAVERWLQLLGELFAGRGYVVAWRRLDGQDQERDRCVLDWSQKTGFAVVASCWPLFHVKGRKPLADIVHCIDHGLTLEQAGTTLNANAEAYLRPEEAMRRLFADEPSWVERTADVAEQLHFSLDQLNYQFPCELEEGETADSRLSRLTWEGAGRRYPKGVPPKVVEQIKKELRLISQLRVAAYFLCTWEVVEIARRLRILCQGRGSAANSAVCYVLGITAVDPSRSSLLFERFLSAERDEPPDIDIDFEHERREEVIQEIYERYGRERAAMVSEVICYRGKSALREVGKAFGLSLEQVDHLTQAITHWDSAGISDEKLRSYGFDPADRRLSQVIHWAQVLEGFPRHLSIHVGGFVLSKTSLFEVAPIEPATMPGRTIIPWDKDDLEQLGFFKVDVLGLGMLTAIRKALALIFQDGALRMAASFGPSTPASASDPQAKFRTARASWGSVTPDEEFDPLEVVTRVPAEDPAVYAMISEADTVGVFQIESRAQMAMLPRLRPQKFYDLVIEVAIVRPGPIQGGMVHPYLKRRNGEAKVEVPHPDLWPILERTLGVPLFQEQVMQLSIVGAGYSGGQADQLRRDMAAWKKSGRLLRHRQRLLDGFASKGIPQAFGEALFEQIKGFGDYGFPESHAASFALLVYLSSWQKAHFPAHFTCALINSQPMGFYSPSSLVRDAQAHGVEVRPVSVVRSNYDCSLEPPTERCRIKSPYPMAARALRLGLRLVKGLGKGSALDIEAARAQSPFASLDDLIRRSSLRKDEVEALAEAGALEELVPGRRQALWSARAPRGVGLFANVDNQEEPVQLPALRASEQLVLDYGRVGLSVDDHPMCHLRAELEGCRVVTAAALADMPHGTMVRVAGLVLSRQRPGTASGVVFVTLEDETGSMNLVLFPKIFERYSLEARHATLMLVDGKVERQVTQPKSGDVGRATPVIHVIVKHIQRLDVGDSEVKHRSRDFH